MHHSLLCGDGGGGGKGAKILFFLLIGLAALGPSPMNSVLWYMWACGYIVLSTISMWVCGYYLYM